MLSCFLRINFEGNDCDSICLSSPSWTMGSYGRGTDLVIYAPGFLKPRALSVARACGICGIGRSINLIRFRGCGHFPESPEILPSPAVRDLTAAPLLGTSAGSRVGPWRHLAAVFGNCTVAV